MIKRRARFGNKYGAKRTFHDGYTFGSMLERAVYDILKLRLAAKEIIKIDCQVIVYLTPARISYRADFRCWENETDHFFVEAKGCRGERWMIIRKLWKVFGPTRLEVWEGRHNKPYLSNTIFPDGEVEND